MGTFEFLKTISIDTDGSFDGMYDVEYVMDGSGITSSMVSLYKKETSSINRGDEGRNNGSSSMVDGMALGIEVHVLAVASGSDRRRVAVA